MTASNENQPHPGIHELEAMYQSACLRHRAEGRAEGYELGYANGLKVGSGQIEPAEPVVFVQHAGVPREQIVGDQ